MKEFKADKKAFHTMMTMKMPFGKYKGRLLLDLPESYLVWFKQKGFPQGKLGENLHLMYEIKLNGLEKMLRNKYLDK